MKSQAEQAVDSVVDAYKNGTDEANRVFTDVCKGLRMFECLILAQMIRQRIDEKHEQQNNHIFCH